MGLHWCYSDAARTKTNHHQQVNNQKVLWGRTGEIGLGYVRLSTKYITKCIVGVSKKDSLRRDRRIEGGRWSDRYQTQALEATVKRRHPTVRRYWVCRTESITPDVLCTTCQRKALYWSSIEGIESRRGIKGWGWVLIDVLIKALS